MPGLPADDSAVDVGSRDGAALSGPHTDGSVLVSAQGLADAELVSRVPLGDSHIGDGPAGWVGPVLRSGHSAESVAVRYPWLAEVNPQRDAAGAMTNCVISAIAFVMAVREGQSFEAPHTDRLPGVDLVNFHRQSLGLDDDAHQVSRIGDFDSAVGVLEDAPQRGAVALIVALGVDDAAINHVYVAVVDERGVSFLDP